MPTHINSASAPPAIGPYTQAVRAGQFIYTSGQLGLHPQTGELAEGIQNQTRQVLLNLTAVLEAADAGLAQVVKTTVFMTDLGEFAQMNAVYAEFFPQLPPARSTVQVTALPKGARVEIECVALAVRS